MLIDDQRRILRALAEGTAPPGIDPDTFRLTVLIVQKLRFELILRGDGDLEAWFDRDAESFTRAFQRYLAEVPAREHFPAREAPRFRGWAVKNGFFANPGPPTASKDP